MAATIQVWIHYGGVDGTPGTTEILPGSPGNLRFNTADDNDQDTDNPIPIVAAATKYSYWKHLCLHCTVAPATKVDNVKVYTDEGGFGTGITVSSCNDALVNTGAAHTDYEVADGTPGDTGTEIITGHTGCTAKTDFFTYGSGDPKSIAISEAGALIDLAGEETDYLALQMTVIDTASPGTLTAETTTWQYDEI